MSFTKAANIQNKKRKELSKYRKNAAWQKASLACSASLTIEASALLPIFLTLMLSLLYIFRIILFQTILQDAMDLTAKKASAYWYAATVMEEKYKDSLEKIDGTAYEWIKEGITELYVANMIKKELETYPFWKSLLEGGENGLWIILPKISEQNRMIDLCVRYKIQIPGFLVNHLLPSFTQRSCVRVWEGAACWGTSADEEESMVYITEYGVVYHTSVECAYLNIQIEKGTQREVEGKKNSFGEAYTRCERCKKTLVGIYVYYTDGGNRWHSDLNCSGITRNIQKIPMSQIGTRRACSKCGS